MDFIIKQIKMPRMCSYLLQSTWDTARALKKKGESLAYRLVFHLHFSHALATSCVLYNRTEHSRGVFIC